MSEKKVTSAKPYSNVCNKDFIDVRGPRFGGGITFIVLAIALIANPSLLTEALVAWQAIVFAIGAFAGVHVQPYGVLYRKVIQPRLGPVKERESTKPPRFAQGVGWIFTVVALFGVAAGATAVTTVALAFALGAAFLQTAFGFCLGCELYLIGKRVLVRA